MILSIIIPTYNERKTIEKIVNRILKIKSLKKEIIIVDDASNDGTSQLLKKITRKVKKIIYHKKLLVRVQQLILQKNL